ncbi:hypothetical protein C6B38_06710 [Spiroplasma sp. ChiS]|uniref:lipoprotein n=1 Tax=Spiroplasma sp. ChiS TaxID=2099885 RepID=UPI000CF9287D|nr:lipoprotein [Spiroplasma sp. ChiS]PQP78381.1 hypothetical protein C6B38_06710 [Spiroplasma sp. ChiS]
MKKWLSLLGAITLIGTSTASLVACNNKTKIHEYTLEELEHLKQENQIYTNWQEIKNNLEWICPQEKPFNKVDNKYYFVVWKGDNQWNINKFKNDEFPKQIIPNSKGKDKILINYGDFTAGQREKELFFVYRDSLTIKYWSDDIEGSYFKYVYRWNGGEENLPYLVVNNDGNIKVNGE